MRYLDRIVGADGYRLDPNNIKIVKVLVRKKLKTLGDVRTLVGMIGYFRKYIPNFSITAEPLYVLLKKTDGQSNSSKSLISWAETQQEALDQLLLCLVKPPILAYPDHNKEFILYADTSGKWLGTVLFQNQEGDLRVISYGSRTLTPAEKKYHSFKLEFLGVKWIVCKQFRDYLYYTPQFHTCTNNNPVTYIMYAGRLTATDQSWVIELVEFSFFCITSRVNRVPLQIH